MMTVATVLATLLVLYLSRQAFVLFKNVSNARAIGLPMVFVPVDQTNLLWLVLSAPNRFRIQRLVPKRLWERVRLAIPGWELFEGSQPFDKYAAHQENSRDAAAAASSSSSSFTLVGPRNFEVWTADPKVAYDILRRIHDFEQPASLAPLLAKFGPNVVTSNGDQWARYRKVVAGVLNERISETIFRETIHHAREKLADLLPSSSDESGGATTTSAQQLFDKVTQITLGVLISASIGESKLLSMAKLDGAGQTRTTTTTTTTTMTPETPYQMTYEEALHTYLDNAFGLAMLPQRVLNHWPLWAPGGQRLRKIGRAVTEYVMRSRSLLDQERRRFAAAAAEEYMYEPEKTEVAAVSSSSSQSSKADFIALLIQASEGDGTGDGTSSGSNPAQALSEDELISNLFAFTAGGFKTIAGALEFVLILLARFPKWQEWLTEEVDVLTSTSTSAEGLDALEYAAVIPRAVRLLAFVLETMRLYGSASRLFKETSAPQTLHTSSGAAIHLPARARVYVDSVAVHRLPSAWRDVNRASDPAWLRPEPAEPDENVFRPSRWINQPGATPSHFLPPKGAFVPWSQGPRICPGQKMAQVEISTVMLCVLARHRVEAVRLPGETARDADERLDARLRDVRWAGIVTLNRKLDLDFKISRRKYV